MIRPAPIPTGAILCENHEDHMRPLRSPKDIPPPWLVAENRLLWSATVEGFPMAWACCGDPYEALAAVCGQVLFWAGLRDEPVPACVIEAVEPTAPDAQP